MNSFLSRIISFAVLLLAMSVNVFAAEKCPQTLTVEAMGVESTVIAATQLQYRLQLFATETPDLMSVACMTFPGTCVTCFYHDSQQPKDNTRIHTLNYRPAVSYFIDGQTIRDQAVSWMNLVIANETISIPFGIYLNSFSSTAVDVKSQQTAILLQKYELVNPTCKPTIVADAEQPCEVSAKTIGTIQSIQIK